MSGRAILIAASGPLAVFAGLAGVLSPAYHGVTFAPDGHPTFAGIGGEIATEPGRFTVYGQGGWATFVTEER